MKLKPRQATAADAELVTAFVNRAYRGDTARAGWTHEADLVGGLRTTSEDIAEIVNDHKSQAIILFASETHPLVATVHVQKQGSAALIGMVAVDPTLQAGGAGREVLRTAEDFAVKEWGVTSFEMTVLDVRSSLMQWYIRRGYQDSGVRIPFKSRFGEAKVENLQFMVLRKKAQTSNL